MPTLYEFAGGDEGLSRVEEAFYSKLLDDPVLKPLFPERRPTHVQYLAWFTAESFGGPSRFTDQVGFDYIIAVHRNLRITDEQKQRFADLYLEAWEESGLLADEDFAEAVRSHIEFGSQVAQQNSLAETDADLNPLRDVPRWTWAKDDPQ